MKTFTATNITMFEKSIGASIVPAKSRKSDKRVIVHFGTSVSIKVSTIKF